MFFGVGELECSAQRAASTTRPAGDGAPAAGAFRLTAAGLLTLAVLAGGCRPSHRRPRRTGDAALRDERPGRDGHPPGRTDGARHRTPPPGRGRPPPGWWRAPNGRLLGLGGRGLPPGVADLRRPGRRDLAPPAPCPWSPGRSVTHLASDGEHTAAAIDGIVRHSPAGRPEAAPCRLRPRSTCAAGRCSRCTPSARSEGDEPARPGAGGRARGGRWPTWRSGRSPPRRSGAPERALGAVRPPLGAGAGPAPRGGLGAGRLPPGRGPPGSLVLGPSPGAHGAPSVQRLRGRPDGGR